MKYLKTFAIWLIQGLISAFFLIFFVVVAIEWMVGCGETYVDAGGKRHANHCLFIDWPKDKK
jgi:hypothetical protein